MATSNARFETIVDGTCEMRDCHHGDGLYVAIVTGQYGTPGLATYCTDHAEALADSDNHEFIGQAEPIHEGES